MILLIDNYDSFTYNLVQLLREAGAEVEVVRNDAIEPAEVAARAARAELRGVVLSPGPGRPENAGMCPALFAARPDLPILGVCLGHQCLGHAWGAMVERAPKLMHGKTSMVRYQDDPLFEGLQNPFQATRYHSLAVRDGSLPAELKPIAWCADPATEGGDEGTVMALRHRELPYWGVQFHPESVLTHAGVHMLRNFLRICGIAVSEEPPQPLVDEAHLEAVMAAITEADLSSAEHP
ncbi:MAG: aminodeoxychorismate/anthranilate synthase component II [Thermoanaerobaculia bacterium]|nr:aminodeoxychorismate/anthranilate synthase component II [Thermoanaerobaculia bacterium]